MTFVNALIFRAIRSQRRRIIPRIEQSSSISQGEMCNVEKRTENSRRNEKEQLPAWLLYLCLCFPGYLAPFTTSHTCLDVMISLLHFWLTCQCFSHFYSRALIRSFIPFIGQIFGRKLRGFSGVHKDITVQLYCARVINDSLRIEERRFGLKTISNKGGTETLRGSASLLALIISVLNQIFSKLLSLYIICKYS